MVRIRMKSMGRRHRPFFRICVMDARTPRDGRTIEELGHYDPLVADAARREVVNVERAAYWLSVGAQPTEKVAVILKRHGVQKPAPATESESGAAPKAKKTRKRDRAARTAAKTATRAAATAKRAAQRAAKQAAAAAPAEETPAGE